MKVALAQIEVSSGEPEANTSKMIKWVERAAREGNDVVVFPEMTDTGYEMPIILKTAQNWESGPAQELAEAAKKYNINVVAGISEHENDNVFNSILVLNRDGQKVGKYRKTHLITAAPMHEEKYLGFGEELVICEIDGVKVGLMTCYEIRFPEIARKLAFAGAELIVITAAFPLIRLSHWQTLTQARAIENQVYVAATSRIGKDKPEGLQFCGTSTIYNPYGVTLSTSSQVHEALVTADVDVDVIKSVRAQIKVHQDVRPNLYSKDVAFH